MNFRNRMLIAVALCVGIMLLFELLNPRPEPAPPEPDVVAEGEAKAAPEQPAKPREAEAVAEAPTDAAAVEGVDHRLRNDVLALLVSNRSPGRDGLIRGIELLSDQFAGHDTATDPFHLGTGHTLAVSFADELSDIKIPMGAAYPVVASSDSQFELLRKGDGVEVSEELELLSGYEARLRVTITNTTAEERQHRLHVLTRIGIGEESRYDVQRGVCRTAEDLEYEDLSDLEDGEIEYKDGIRWGGVDSKYFGTYVVPEVPFAACNLSRADGFLVADLMGEAARLGPGETKTYLFGVYIGPKEIERLEAFSAVELPEGQLEEAVDWGFLGSVSEALGRMLLSMLRWFHELTGIWGVAIILLTVVVKLVTLPLTLKQMRSMKHMREIQPEIAKIKEKYADDRVKQGQEMQALFARSGVNPLAGCLPMLVQLPIWFALYSMLNTAAELLHEPFLWLPDLTKQDPYYILPLALGVMMILQNRMMPTAGDEAQAKMMRWMMPIMFTLFMLFLPSGLGVYIFVNIVLSVIQTAIQVGTKTEAKAAT